MNKKMQRRFRKELEQIPSFEEYEKCIEQIVNSAPMDKSYEFMVADLCPQVDKFLPALKSQANIAVLISVMLAKLIEARRGFPA